MERGERRRFEGPCLFVRGGVRRLSGFGCVSHELAMAAAKPGWSIVHTAAAPPGGNVADACFFVQPRRPQVPSTWYRRHVELLVPRLFIIEL